MADSDEVLSAENVFSSLISFVRNTISRFPTTGTEERKEMLTELNIPLR